MYITVLSVRFGAIGAPFVLPAFFDRLDWTSRFSHMFHVLRAENMAAPSSDVQVVPVKKPAGKCYRCLKTVQVLETFFFGGEVIDLRVSERYNVYPYVFRKAKRSVASLLYLRI